MRAVRLAHNLRSGKEHGRPFGAEEKRQVSVETDGGRKALEKEQPKASSTFGVQEREKGKPLEAKEKQQKFVEELLEKTEDAKADGAGRSSSMSRPPLTSRTQSKEYSSNQRKRDRNPLKSFSREERVCRLPPWKFGGVPC